MCNRIEDLIEKARHYEDLWHEALDDNKRLEAEVEQYERVVKAGDAMAKRTEFFQKRWDADELCQEVEAWNAVKEGKPSV